MHKKILAAAIAATMASSAMALEVYNDDTNSLSIGGRIGVVGQKSNGSDTTLKNDSARINFKFAHKFDNGWTGEAVSEWGFRAKDEYADIERAGVVVGSEKLDTFFNRLGYVGLSHDVYGAFSAGKNWSVSYDVSGWTDVYAIGGGNAMGIYDGRNGGDVDGTARADDVLQYRANFSGLNVGVEYLMSSTSKDNTIAVDDDSGVPYAIETKRKDGYSVALSYDLPMGLSLGATYSEAKFEELDAYQGQDKSKSATAGVKFQNDMFYAAAMYGQFRNKTSVDSGLDQESTGFELYGSMALPIVREGFSLQAGWNQLEADKAQNGSGHDGKTKTEAEFKEAMVGAIYETGPMQFAFEYAKSNTKDHAGEKDRDETFSVQARYYF